MTNALVRLCAALIAAGAAAGVGTQAFAQSDDFFTVPPPSGAFFSGNLLYAWRSTGDGGAAIINTAPSGPAVYSAGDVTPGPRFGADLRLGYDDKDGWGVETRYFGGFRWNGGADLGAPPSTFLIGSTTISGATDLTANVASELDTIEFNARRYLNSNLLVFAGARGVRFNDAFGATAIGSSATLRFQTDTGAWGPQVGAQYKYSFKNSTGGEIAYIDADVRGGVLFERNTDAFARNGSLVVTSGAAASTASGFVEAGITVGHRLARYSVEAGYRVFYVDRVPTGEAYAADALAITSVNGAPVYTSLLVQAMTLGLKVTF